jgi:hypothetical protein
MRSTLTLLSALFAVACLSPSTSERRSAAGISAERDVAAALGTWTVRAYQPVVSDTSLRSSLSLQPAMHFGQPPVWLVKSGDAGHVTIVGPYRNPVSGVDEITRIETRIENGRSVGTYYTRALKSGQASRGSFNPMPSMVVAAN